jgi:hypothetical protein
MLPDTVQPRPGHGDQQAGLHLACS